MLGTSLETLEADSQLYLMQMKGLKREQAFSVCSYMRQVILNLLGQNNAENPACLSQDLPEKVHLRCPFLVSSAIAYSGLLQTYFGDYVAYADIIIKLGHDHNQKVNIGAPFNMWDTFLKGVSCFAAARETGKVKYAKMGKIFRSKLKKWLDQGNPNVKHYKTLLDAEWMAFKGKNATAVMHYEAAILLAARGGYQHDAALATERLGDFHLTISGDLEEAAYQIGLSRKYWGEWGALAKVNHLCQKYANIIPT